MAASLVSTENTEDLGAELNPIPNGNPRGNPSPLYIPEDSHGNHSPLYIPGDPHGNLSSLYLPGDKHGNPSPLYLPGQPDGTTFNRSPLNNISANQQDEVAPPLPRPRELTQPTADYTPLAEYVAIPDVSRADQMRFAAARLIR